MSIETSERDQSIRWQYVALATLVGLLLWQAFMQRTHLGDDAYITLTYSKNLARGDGFVFNNGPATLGTTTPLLAMLIAFFTVILPFVPIPTIAVMLGGLAWSGIGLIFHREREVWGLTGWQAVGVTLVLVATTRLFLLGMEVSLFAFLLVLAMTLFLRERWLLSGVTVGLLFLTRGEGVMLLPILGLYHLVEVRSIRKAWPAVLRLGLGALIPVVVWSVVALLAVGRVLPDTLAAKKAQLASEQFAPFSRRVWSEWIPRFGEDFSFGPIHAWRILVAVGVLDAVRRHRSRLLLAGWFAIYIIGYSLLGVAGYGWYRETLVFVGNLFFAFGAIALVTLVATKSKPLARGLGLAMCGVIAWVLLIPSLQTSTRLNGDHIEAAYRPLTDWLNDNASPDERVGYMEIGYIGYFTELEMVDLAGLVSPDAVPYIAEGNFTQYFWDELPEYFIDRPAFRNKMARIINDPCFTASYERVFSVPAPRPDTGELIVLRRTVAAAEVCQPSA